MLDKPAPELVRSHLARLFDGDDEGNDSGNINVRIKRIGRKKLLKPNFTKSKSTELSQLRNFLSKRSGKQIRFVEEFMCEELGTNINYLRKAVRLGKNLLKLLEEREHKYEKMTEEELQKNYPELFCNIHKL